MWKCEIDEEKTKEGRRKGSCNEAKQEKDDTNDHSYTVPGLQISRLELTQKASSRRTSSQGEDSITTRVKSNTLSHVTALRASVSGAPAESLHIPASEECLTTWCDVEKIIYKLGSKPQDEYDHEMDRIQKIAGQDRIEVHERFAEEREDIAAGDKSRDERAAAIAASKSAEQEEIARINNRLDLEHVAADSALAASKNKQDRALGKVKTRLRTMLATQYR
jgi:hypothetical protein